MPLPTAHSWRLLGTPIAPAPSPLPCASKRRAVDPTPLGHAKDAPAPATEKYRTGKTLGRWTYGILQEVVYIRTGKSYARKEINKKRMEGWEVVVENEIAFSKRISSAHQNIVRLYDYFETLNEVYLVSDLCGGGSLFDRISTKGSYQESDAAELVRTIMKAVQHIHDSGIVHRDLKPENLLFRTPGEDTDVMIAEFGLSGDMEEERYHLLMEIYGTSGYMAPEIFKKTGHGKPVDIWAMGVMTYFLLTGHRPFDHESPQLVVQAIIAGDYKFEPEEYWSGVSETAKEFVTMCLTVDPMQRPTAEEALKHRWLADETVHYVLDPGGTTGGPTDLDPHVQNRLDTRMRSRNRETCGLLLGKYNDGRYVVTTLLIPKQHAMGDTCAIVEEELVMQFTEERSLIILGWIHTHPTQPCSMSSIDLHKHSGFQRILPESFAVVCAPNSTPDFGIFRLTDPPGLKTIMECQMTEAFHLHPEGSIYMDAATGKGHVQISDIPLKIDDLREDTALLHKPFALLSEDTLEFFERSLSRFRHSEAGHIGGEEGEVAYASRTASERNDSISKLGTLEQRPATLPASKTSAECGIVSHTSKLPSISDGDGLVFPTDTFVQSETAANHTPEISAGPDMLYRAPESQLHSQQLDYLRILQDKFGTPGHDRGHRYSCSDEASACNEGNDNYRKSFVDPDNESYNVRCSVKTTSKSPFSSLRTVSSASSRAIGDGVQLREGAVSMEESHIHSSVQPRIRPMPEDDKDERGYSDDSDRNSKMSFSYWGADTINLQNPLTKHRPGPGGIGSRRNGPAVSSGYSRESSANAKFGNRLVSADSLAATASPASRLNVKTPSSNVGQPREGVLMEDVVRSKSSVVPGRPRITPIPENDYEGGGGDYDDSDRWSTKPLYNWRADMVTLQKPLAKHRPGPGGIGSRRNGPAVPSSYSRESSANAKFGNRLLSADSLLAAATRPASRRNVTVRRRIIRDDEGPPINITVIRPAWDGSIRRTLTSAQSHNTAQHNAARDDTAAPSNNKTLTSPAPSEDSSGALSPDDGE